MSVAFASARPRGKGEVTQQTIQKVKKHAFLQTILDIYSDHAPVSRGRRLISRAIRRSSEFARACGDGQLEREVGEGGGGGGGTKQRCSDHCKERERRTRGIKSGRHAISAARSGEKKLPVIQWEIGVKSANTWLISDGVSASAPTPPKKSDLKNE